MTSRSPGARHDERPQQVETAYILSLTAIALQLVSWVMGSFVIEPTGFDEMRQEVGQDQVVQQLALSAVALCVICVLWALLAVKMREGQNWARLVLAAATALSALFLVNSLSMSGYPWDELVGAAPDLVAYGAIAMMFLPSSNAYFVDDTVEQ
ncbi:hypothetical protein [Streptomyces cucumeris]|uniref:hypothetical protein n=1 Tax=Streptomyces cucumeris TaxID=2962890 RepID=UPI0020C8EC24|nr:hypothetical protein [Streptomyces sp. NEAU-Y11]MCP9212253.1 hypothetical protein [Streptomyces sp. NEAU-Y11]